MAMKLVGTSKIKINMQLRSYELIIGAQLSKMASKLRTTLECDCMYKIMSYIVLENKNVLLEPYNKDAIIDNCHVD